MRSKLKITMVFLLNTFIAVNLFAQIPLVYDVENTGADFPKPNFPTISELPVVEPLPDPFMWSSTDPSGWTDSTTARSTNFNDWSKRRSEIAWDIQNYEIGTKPPRPDTLSASFANDTLTINITKNGQSMTMTCPVILPAGDGPFPAIIGMNSPTGSIPSSVFSSRNIAEIAYMHNQVTTYGSPTNNDPFFRLYPEQNVSNTGQYAAWAWGVSRIIDGLELVQDVLPIDLSHIGVTGCSYAGKMALFAGAFDERVALTIPQESGGGGVANWRVSETIGAVEKLSATDSKWFKDDMFTFGGTNVAKLPSDHHELVVMVAPRALITVGNPGIAWLADPSAYVSLMAAREVYKTWGIEDRLGFVLTSTHDHCALPADQTPDIEAFVDKFLLGDSTVNTNITKSVYETMNYERWIDWWGTNKPEFPAIDATSFDNIYIEAERLVSPGHGTDFMVVKDTAASNGYYITVTPGTQALNAAPTDSVGLVTVSFTTTNGSDAYNIFARINCASADDDSFWFKLDDGDFNMLNGLGTGGVWNWTNFLGTLLDPGKHTITIGYREDGAKLDKLYITNYPYAPTDKGGIDSLALNWTPPVGIKSIDGTSGYILNDCYPNPFTGKTTISYTLPGNTFVSLKVYNILGDEITELAGKKYSQGEHRVVFDAACLPKGIYFYTMKAGNFMQMKKMVVQ